MVIVDSSVWIDALWGTVNRHTLWLRSNTEEEVGLNSLILYEVLQGVRSHARFRESRRYLMNFPIFDPLSPELAVTAAQNYRLLRGHGITVSKPVDCIIATFCIESGHKLLHRDSDFDAFEMHLGLLVLHPPGTPVN